MKYWEKLIVQWRKEGKDGLTIPFLIGARSLLQPEEGLLDVKSLLAEIASNSDSKVYIKYCLEIDEIIIGVFDTSKEKNAGEFLKFDGNEQNNFFITKPFVEGWKSSLEFGIEYLSERYERPLNESKYSFRNRDWATFSQSDMEFIERAKT